MTTPTPKNFRKEPIEVLESKLRGSSVKKAKVVAGQGSKSIEKSAKVNQGNENIIASSDLPFYALLPNDFQLIKNETSKHLNPKHDLQDLMQNQLLSKNQQHVFQSGVVNQHLLLDCKNIGNIAPTNSGSKSKARKKVMSCKERKKSGLFDLSNLQVDYKDFLPLHELWKQYMSDWLNSDFSDEARPLDENKLLKADFHGAVISVVRSKVPQHVGIQGILILETLNVFRIMTTGGLKCILFFLCIFYSAVPKKNTIFCFTIGVFTITLYGNSLIMRSEERSVRKFKTKNTIEL